MTIEEAFSAHVAKQVAPLNLEYAKERNKGSSAKGSLARKSSPKDFQLQIVLLKILHQRAQSDRLQTATHMTVSRNYINYINLFLLIACSAKTSFLSHSLRSRCESIGRL